MSHTFRPGDVVQYRASSIGRWVDGIVAEPPRDDLADEIEPLWAIWCDKDDGWADKARFVDVARTTVMLHPDPDPVLADYVKHRLMGEPQ